MKLVVRTTGSLGFTLVELILVVMIIGVLATAYTRPLTNIHAFEEHSTMHELVSALRFARVFVLTTGCSVDVTFEADAMELFVGSECNDNIYKQPIYHPGTLKPYRVELADGLHMRMHHVYQGTDHFRAVLHYHPTGNACNESGKGTSKVVITGSSHYQRLITIDCGTSHVTFG